MKGYIHARLGKEDRAALEELKATTGQSESELLRRGLQLVAQEERRQRSALDLAGRSVGRFTKGPRDLSTNRKHIEGFGE
jgi:Arc/MetJ-type ribon-helix-helix transcriptional regulator